MLLLVTGCAKIKVRNIHTAPEYICEGDHVPIQVKWNYIQGKGKVKIFTKGGYQLCEAGIKRELCTLNRGQPWSEQDDFPLVAKVFKKGKLVKEKNDLTYKVLSGPTLTRKFPHTGTHSNTKTITVDIERPVYGCCEGCPNGKNSDKVCVDVLDDAGNPVLGPDGNPVPPDCTCPDQGKIIRTETIPETRQNTAVDNLEWAIHGTWFAADVKTLEFIYPSKATKTSKPNDSDPESNGANQTTPFVFVGPGIEGEHEFIPGNAISGNNISPSGLWIGKVIPGSEPTFVDDGETLINYYIQFLVKCE
jgi:hypothetical protein